LFFLSIFQVKIWFQVSYWKFVLKFFYWFIRTNDQNKKNINDQINPITHRLIIIQLITVTKRFLMMKQIIMNLRYILHHYYHLHVKVKMLIWIQRIIVNSLHQLSIQMIFFVIIQWILIMGFGHHISMIQIIIPIVIINNNMHHPFIPKKIRIFECCIVYLFTFLHWK